jgi:hypothetical protein
MAGATTQADRQAQVLAAGYNGPLTDAAINQAYANAATPSDLASSGISNRQQASPSPISPSTAPTTINSAAAQQAAAGAQALLAAAASGNKAALDETIREFDKNFGLNQQQLAEQIRQFNQNYVISQAGVTGAYGTPGFASTGTLAAQNQQGNLAAQQAQITGYYNPLPQGSSGNLAVDAFQFRANPHDQQIYLNAEGGDPLKAAQHYFRDVTGAVQQAVQNAGGQWTPNSLSDWVYGTSGAAGGGQGTPTLAAQAQWAQLYGANAVPTQGQTTLAAQQQQYAQQTGLVNLISQLQANPFKQQAALGQLQPLLRGGNVAGFGQTGTVPGAGTGGMGYLQQMVDDIKSGGASNTTTTNQILDAIPTPNKMDSVNFFKAPQTTQNLVLQGIQEKYGLDPNDSLQMLKNTLPGFQAPATFGTVKRPG